MLEEIAEQGLSKLNAHRYESVLVAFTADLEAEVVEIHIRARQAQELLYLRAGIGDGERKRMQPFLRTFDRFECISPLMCSAVKVAKTFCSSFNLGIFTSSVPCSLWSHMKYALVQRRW